MTPDATMVFHHIGIACHDIERTRAFYESMGYMAGRVVSDAAQGVNVCFMEHDSAPRLELLQPLSDDSPVLRTLNAVGVSPYHQCYQVDDIEQAIKTLRRQQRFVLVSRPVPACALNGKRVAFLYHKDVGLIELLEK